MHWIWIWISTSLPAILAVSILLESVQQHEIWTILYRSSLIGLVYSGVVFLIGVFILSYLQPQKQTPTQTAKQDTTHTGGPVGSKNPGSTMKATVKP